MSNLIKRIAGASALLLLVVLAGACNVSINRNTDGSLSVEASISETAIQAEIEAALNDPLIQELSVDLQDGYILVTGERRRISGSQTDTLSFRLDLGVKDGHLSAVVSEAQIDGIPIDEARVKVWNQRIANRLERAGQRNPNSTLQSVTVTPDAVKMTWRVETRRSREN